MMKKTRIYFLYLITTAIITGISSCSKKEDQNDQNLQLNFTVGPGYISGNATLSAGEHFKVGIHAIANASTGAPVTRLTIIRTFINKPDTVMDSTMSTTVLAFDFNTFANGEIGEETWNFILRDRDGFTAEKSFVITTVSTPGPIQTYTQKILGAQLNAAGNFLATDDGTIYTLPDAKNNSNRIDFLYFYSFTTMANLAAPDDVEAATVYNDPVNGLQTWAVLNPTLFKKITDPVDWDAIQDDTQIIVLTQTGVTEPKVSNLAVHDFIAFITGAGKKGLLRVDLITGEDEGTIEISVKVQE